MTWPASSATQCPPRFAKEALATDRHANAVQVTGGTTGIRIRTKIRKDRHRGNISGGALPPIFLHGLGVGTRPKHQCARAHHIPKNALQLPHATRSLPRLVATRHTTNVCERLSSRKTTQQFLGLSICRCTRSIRNPSTEKTGGTCTNTPRHLFSLPHRAHAVGDLCNVCHRTARRSCHPHRRSQYYFAHHRPRRLLAARWECHQVGDGADAGSLG